jgi:hypothetical protein
MLVRRSFCRIGSACQGGQHIIQPTACQQWLPTRYGWDGVRASRLFLDGPGRREAVGGHCAADLGAGNFLFRSHHKIIEQQLLPPSGPPRRVSGVSPYKPHHERVELESLSPDFLLRGHSCNFKEVGHPSDGASSIYGHHRIAVVDFNFASIHFVAHLRAVTARGNKPITVSRIPALAPPIFLCLASDRAGAFGFFDFHPMRRTVGAIWRAKSTAIRRYCAVGWR